MLGREVTHLTREGLLPCVFYGQMGDQEFLFRSGVFTVVALEGPVVGMGQLVVEQQLLVVTTEVAKLTLELAVSKTLDVGQEVHFECVALFEGFATLIAHVWFL